jgi:phosphoadenosine phosphosulfate reductase
MRKVEPLERALSEVDAWITGLRRDQSPTRAGTAKLAPDEGHPGKLKCAPLADWSEKDVWGYIAEHDVPYHPLHDRGYESIGCTHCTVAGGGRDGRWAGTDKIECGLHLPGG